jgi:hypothetical protein
MRVNSSYYEPRPLPLLQVAGRLIYGEDAAMKEDSI